MHERDRNRSLAAIPVTWIGGSGSGMSIIIAWPEGRLPPCTTTYHRHALCAASALPFPVSEVVVSRKIHLVHAGVGQHFLDSISRWIRFCLTHIVLQVNRKQIQPSLTPMNLCQQQMYVLDMFGMVVRLFGEFRGFIKAVLFDA